jgi:drug/metabolite transporter (DMT)-like permease
MALSAGAVWSFGAVTARLADGSDAFQYLVWRSIGIIVVIEGWAFVTRRPHRTIQAYTSGRRMIVANLALLLASIGFVYAVKTTTAANAAFLGATTPLFGVAMARLFLGERITPRTVAIVAAAFAGLLVMVVGDLHAGNIVGDLAAVSSAIGFAAYTAIVKSAPDRDWSPVLPGYGVLMIAICAAVTLGNSKPLVPPAPDIALAVVHGGLFIVAGTLLYNGASRNVPAAAMTVFAQTEMVLVPLWAFLVLAERPRPATIVGGTIILAAVLTKAVGDARVDRAAATTTSTTDEPPPPPEGPALAPAA